MKLIFTKNKHIAIIESNISSLEKTKLSCKNPETITHLGWQIKILHQLLQEVKKIIE